MNNWIPVTERLPEDGQEVIFCDRDVVYEGFYLTSRRTHKKEWRPAYSSVSIGRVTAWMPLPEPYREEEADDLITAFPNGERVTTECVKATIHHMPTIIEAEE